MDYNIIKGKSTLTNSVDAYTGTLSIGDAAYTNGGIYIVTMPDYANTTTTPTLNLNSIGAKTIVNQQGTALSIGQLYNGCTYVLVYSLSFDHFRLLGLSVPANLTFYKEQAHTITVDTSTTSTSAGGALTIVPGTGETTGAGGQLNVKGGNGGGTTSAGGNVEITPGTSTSTTISPVTIVNKGMVNKPTSASVASGATITGIELVNGLITATGATGNWQLPSTANITTAIGTTPAGTTFDFCVNATGMTAGNTATLVVGANMTVSSSPAITGGGSLTLTQDTQVIGWWRITYVSSTTCKIQRIA